MNVCEHSQLCPTPCNPTDCSPPGSSVQGILQARILEEESPFPPPGDLPNPGLEPKSLASPALAGGFFTTSASGKPKGHQNSETLVAVWKNGWVPMDRRILFPPVLLQLFPLERMMPASTLGDRQHSNSQHFRWCFSMWPINSECFLCIYSSNLHIKSVITPFYKWGN